MGVSCGCGRRAAALPRCQAAHHEIESLRASAHILLPVKHLQLEPKDGRLPRNMQIFVKTREYRASSTI